MQPAGGYSRRIGISKYEDRGDDLTCIDLAEVRSAAVLLEKQAGTLRTISAELEEISQVLKRNKTLLYAGAGMGKGAGRLEELSNIMCQMERALEMTAAYQQQTEMRIAKRYEGSRSYTAPKTVLVDCAAWEKLPDDILIY